MSLCLLFLSTHSLFSTRGIVLAVVLIASLAKFIPAYFMTKYVAKKETDFAVAVGVLMNTRGLITLIGVNIGVDSVCHLFLHLCASVWRTGMFQGIIGVRMFSILVLMAIITTMMTPPLFWLVWLRRHPPATEDVLAQPQQHETSSEETSPLL
jgi:hypothetical protein